MPNIVIYSTQKGKSKSEVVRKFQTTAKDNSMHPRSLLMIMPYTSVNNTSHASRQISAPREVTTSFLDTGVI